MSGLQSELRVTVGLIYYTVYLGNKPLGSGDETDGRSSENKDKTTGRIFTVSGEVFRRLRNSGLILLLPSWERRPH